MSADLVEQPIFNCAGFHARNATMDGMSKELRVTQLFDCTDVGRNFVRKAQRQGQPWKIIDGPWARGGTESAYYRFLLEMAAVYPRIQVWHVNIVGRAKWARRRFSRPYALSVHGTDLRESYWHEEHHETIKVDAGRPGLVWCATKNYREKAEQARSDAEFMPINVDVAELPAWCPAGKPRVCAFSRWVASKGRNAWVRTAADVVTALEGLDVNIVGHDWCARAAEVAAMCVQLFPRKRKAEYLHEVSLAHVALGPITGILATSELEAMGMGTSTIFADQDPDYPADGTSASTARDEVWSAACESLAEPVALSTQLGSVDSVLKSCSPDVLPHRFEKGCKNVLEATS